MLEKSDEFRELYEELHRRGFTPNAKVSETWSLMVVYPGAIDQASCEPHQDAGGQRSLYLTNIIPLTVDPSEAGGTVVCKAYTKDAGFNKPGNQRYAATPINTYGYVLSFRGQVWHYGTANTTENHNRIYLMQDLSEKADINDAQQRPNANLEGTMAS